MDAIIEEAEELGKKIIEDHRKTIELLSEFDEEKSKTIKANSIKLDEDSFHLERQCIRFMATEHPFAGDLVFVESLIRVGSHLKRIAYLLSNIAEISSNAHSVKIPSHLDEKIQYMGDYVQMMLSKSIYAFLNQNIVTAKELKDDDDKVDDLFDSILKEIIDLMSEDSENIKAYMDIIFTARFLERIADRAVSIGARTIFILTFKKPRG
jgi:phosphate transport system protein